jgi:hypothetical protein
MAMIAAGRSCGNKPDVGKECELVGVCYLITNALSFKVLAKDM